MKKVKCRWCKDTGFIDCSDEGEPPALCSCGASGVGQPRLITSKKAPRKPLPIKLGSGSYFLICQDSVDIMVRNLSSLNARRLAAKLLKFADWVDARRTKP